MFCPQAFHKGFFFLGSGWLRQNFNGAFDAFAFNPALTEGVGSQDVYFNIIAELI